MEIYEQRIVPFLTIVHYTEVLEQLLDNFQYVTYRDYRFLLSSCFKTSGYSPAMLTQSKLNIVYFIVHILYIILGPLFQKIALAQRKKLQYTIFLLTTDLISCTFRTAVTSLFLLSLFYVLISKKRQRMHFPTDRKEHKI